jgi:hypothetical protein
MIIKRLLLKLFGRRRDPMQKPEDQYKFDMDLADELGVEPELFIEKTSTYNKDYEKLTSSEKKLAKSYIKDLEDGLFYDESENSGDNHYLSDFSNTSALDPFHRLSRRINGSDRFNYMVYRPKIFNDEKGNLRYIQKVVLESCKEHKLCDGRRY